jgi:hypothetical protein
MKRQVIEKECLLKGNMVFTHIIYTAATVMESRFPFNIAFGISIYIWIICASCEDNKISYSNPPAKQVG